MSLMGIPGVLCFNEGQICHCLYAVLVFVASRKAARQIKYFILVCSVEFHVEVPVFNQLVNLFTSKVVGILFYPSHCGTWLFH